jgi:hypothetical protein
MKAIIAFLPILILASCSSGLTRKQVKSHESMELVTTNENGKGPLITVTLYKGQSFYFPLMSVWLEDENGNYIQTLFVARSIAKGFFLYGKQENNKWVPGAIREPQTLPYWAHKRGIKASDGLYVPDQEHPVPDAYSGATPVTGFTLVSKADSTLPDKYRVMLEINQNWDWNEFWTNDKYPDDENYKMSCQPALVYEAYIEGSSLKESYIMKPVGHSHYSGKTGELFPDLSTITTALHIADSIVVKVKK